MMHMWYWFGTDLGTFLFSGYNVNTVWALLSTCLGLAALAIIFEAMKISDIKLQRAAIASRRNKPPVSSSEDSSLLSRVSARSLAASPFAHCETWYKWAFQVFHWSLHTTVGYLLMMAVMTYNGYITVAIIIGSCIGYWIFGPVIVRLNIAQFYESQKAVQCDEDCADTVTREGHAPIVPTISEQITSEITVDIHR